MVYKWHGFSLCLLLAMLCAIILSFLLHLLFWLPLQGSARTEEGATPAPAKKASAGECEKVEGQGERGEGDADAEEAAALLHHFANGRL